MGCSLWATVQRVAESQTCLNIQAHMHAYVRACTRTHTHTHTSQLHMAKVRGPSRDGLTPMITFYLTHLHLSRLGVLMLYLKS